MNRAAILAIFIFVASGCSDKTGEPGRGSDKNLTTNEKDIWGTCAQEYRARIVKITDVNSDSEQLTLKYEVGGKEEVTPVYKKNANGFIAKIGAPFCMEEDLD